MTDEIEKIFSATAQSPRQFLSVHGQGCYIPAYQRAYSWDGDNVDRLLEDALNGVNQLILRPKAISFLGTIIAIHDTKYRTVQPIFRPHVPPRVMTIIDGQQRICTFAMLNVAIHDHIRRHVVSLERRSDEHSAWLLDQCRILLAELEGTFRIDMATGEGAYRFYPRVTRAYEDAWSKRAGEARYASPVAKLIWDYISSDSSPAHFRHQPKDAMGAPLTNHKTVSDVFGHIQTSLSRLSMGHKNYDFPELQSITKNEEFCEAIWGFSIPEAVDQFVREGNSLRGHRDFCATLRIVIIARYLNNRMAFTIVTTESEDDAFDMFEALNTTGEPLTAFETFKPRVIETEKLEKYENSPSRPFMTTIQDYLDQFRKADERQQATSEFLIPFALSETGDKLQRRLNEQRRYLRDQYDSIEDHSGKRDFVRSLSHVATFMQHGWRPDIPRFPGLELNDDQALLCFQALRHLKHNITVAPLARFYDEARRAEDGERIAKTTELAAAIRATAAFTMLWRAAKGGTENIDAQYRDIMKSAGSATASDGSTSVIPPFARRISEARINVENYTARLRNIILKEYPDKDEWVKAASRTPIFKHSAAIAKFMLLCASHDAVPDGSDPGLVKRGVTGVAPLLASAVWNDPSYLTVEHVAPQSRAQGWDNGFDDDPDAAHRLGNLTLLPQVENSIVGNRQWEQKTFLYRMLSAETQEERATIKEEAAAAGFTLGLQTGTAMTQAKHLNLCRSIVTVQGGWTVSLVDHRSRRLSELAWEVLAPWLGLQP
jgi:Protein of unknown function DUF262/Protein of unknown function (DUF1524)